MIDVALKRHVPGFDLDVAFRNDAGLTALFGRSGSGKSMTIGMIAGLMRPDEGHVRIGGTVLVDTSRGIVVPLHKRRIGMVFQDAHLFPHMNVRHNLLYGRRFAPADTHAIALEAVVETLGIGRLLARRPGGLSGGERQRVAIGRALLACPRLLLFDEPFAALDRQRKLEVLPLIERLRDEFRIPIVYVSHALEEVVRLAAHVVVVDGGRVTAAGPPEQIFSHRGRDEGSALRRYSVLTTTIGARDEAYGLTALHHAAGTLWVAGAAGSHGGAARVVIDATDVTLAIGAPGALSVRSVLRGTVVGVDAAGAVAAVEIALVGGGALVAQATRMALDDLDLKPGCSVSALIKTVALDETTI